MKIQLNQIILEITSTPLLSLAVDALVNATDPGLSLSPALAKQTGQDLQQQLSLIGYCDIGAAVITNAGLLPMKHIIHAVGPRWGDNSMRGKLASATWETLQLAENHHVRSIALPAIATGSDGGYPVEACARIMLQEIIDFTFEPLQYLQHIYISPQLKNACTIFEQELHRQIQQLDDDNPIILSVGQTLD